MKQGSLLLAALVLVGGLLRLTGPATLSPGQDQDASRKSAGSAHHARTPYPDEIASTIQDFYGAPAENAPPDASLAAHWNVPAAQREKIAYCVALLPDPVHTHLALFFDRSVEALVQAAQKKGYIFDRSILPWD